jgi:hypothetical protein
MNDTFLLPLLVLTHPRISTVSSDWLSASSALILAVFIFDFICRKNIHPGLSTDHPVHLSAGYVGICRLTLLITE